MLPTIQIMNLFGNADSSALLFALADNAIARQFTLCVPAARYLSWGWYSDKVRQLYVLCELDYESFLNHGHELYLTSNGIVLSYADVAPMYLTFHYRPPHEKDPGGLKYEKKKHEAGVGSSHEEGTSASASASRTSDQAANSSMPKGGSPQGEVPTLDKDALQKLIREDELKERRRPPSPRDPLAMLTSKETPCVAKWMQPRPSSRRSSTTFSARRGQIPGISSSLVFCVVSMTQGCGWRHHTETRLFGSLRSTVSLPT